MSEEPFEIPLPPGAFGPPPPPPSHRDFFFFRSAPDESEDAPRSTEDIMLRRVPREIAGRFRAGAGGRGLTHAQYLTALVELHRRLRERADGGDEDAGTLLAELGLASVTV